MTAGVATLTGGQRTRHDTSKVRAPAAAATRTRARIGGCLTASPPITLAARDGIRHRTDSGEGPGWHGATNEHVRAHVSDEQRSQTGWITARMQPEIHHRVLSRTQVRRAPVFSAHGRAAGTSRASRTGTHERLGSASAAPAQGDPRMRYGRVGSARAAGTSGRQPLAAAGSGGPARVDAPARIRQRSGGALDHLLRDAARRVLHYYPLSLLGTAVCAAAVYLLGSAFASGSPHEFLLSVTGFLILLVLAALGRLQAYRFKLVEFEWDSSAPLGAREYGAQHRLRTRAAKSWLFYRIHLRIAWRLQAGRRAVLRGYREAATSGGEAAIGLWFPCSGVLQMTGRLTVRDVFGLTRAQIRPPERRTLVVRPGLLAEQATPPVEISTGFDTTQRAQTSDEEQYFMREYIPGDRLKDINWKATSRLGELITRISPITQEQTQELHVVLRRYRRRGGETLTAVLHLDFIKSWLLTFLRVVKQHHPEYVFIVDSGGESHRIDTPDEIERLARRLAELPLTSELPAAGTAQPRELFIFSTVFDEDLPRFVERSGAQYVNVFRTVPVGQAGEDEPDPYRMSVCDTPLPTCAGGGWLLARERRVRASAAVAGRQPGMREQQPLKVSYLCTSSS